MNHEKLIAITLILTLGLFLTIGCFGPFTEEDKEVTESKEDEGATEPDVDEDEGIPNETDEEIAEYTLTIHTSGEGSTTPYEGEHTYEEGETILVEHVADYDWEFDEWSGDCSGTTCELTMDEDKSVTANFKPEGEPLEYEVIESNWGTEDGETYTEVTVKNVDTKAGEFEVLCIFKRGADGYWLSDRPSVYIHPGNKRTAECRIDVEMDETPESYKVFPGEK